MPELNWPHYLRYCFQLAPLTFVCVCVVERNWERKRNEWMGHGKWGGALMFWCWGKVYFSLRILLVFILLFLVLVLAPFCWLWNLVALKSIDLLLHSLDFTGAPPHTLRFVCLSVLVTIVIGLTFASPLIIIQYKQLYKKKAKVNRRMNEWMRKREWEAVWTWNWFVVVELKKEMSVYRKRIARHNEIRGNKYIFYLDFFVCRIISLLGNLSDQSFLSLNSSGRVHSSKFWVLSYISLEYTLSSLF